MPTPVVTEVTQLLLAWSEGDSEALDRLIPLVYQELRQLARHYMRREQAGHTLETTALIHEAYLRLIDAKQVQIKNRAHFFGVSARLMRQILVDAARSRGYEKRGGGTQQVSLDAALTVTQKTETDLLAIDEALSALAAVDMRKSQVVEMRFFWRFDRNRDCHGAEGVHRNSEARLAISEILVADEAGWRRA